MALSECKEALADGTDRLLYKLVRVEEDGTIVPASEDEVLQMESLMEERSPIHVDDTETRMECNSDGCTGYGQKEILNSTAKISIGSTCSEFLEGDKKKLLAQLVFLDALLHVLDVEQENINLGNSNQKGQELTLVTNTGTGSSRELQIPSSRNDLNWPIHVDGSSFAASAGDSKGTIKDAELDLLTGNVSLDKLSIRELHEAFRTTFRQHTSSKDKLCLKERITIGSLETINSDNGNGDSMFASTDFFFDDGTYRLPPDTVFSLDLDSKLAGQTKVYRRKHSKTVTSCQFMKHKEASLTAYEFATSEDSGSTDKDVQMGSSGNEGKRKRRPTKRFIEELTVCDMKDDMAKTFLSSAIKDFDHGSYKSNISSKDQAVQMVADDNIMMSDTTTECNHGRCGKTRKRRKNAKTSGRAAQLVRKAKAVCAARMIGKPSLSKVKTRPIHNASSVITSAPSSPSSPSEQNLESASKFSEVASLENKGMSGDHENGKKRHHPWSLKEVVKLLDGVTHCGVGNWTDVKKFSFPEPADRSPTDIKDKWRNLVRASKRHHKLNSQRGEHRRKHYGSFVPGAILMQVHDLLMTKSGTRRRRRGRNAARKH